MYTNFDRLTFERVYHVSTGVTSRAAKLVELRGRFYASQMFNLPSSKTLENFVGAAHYSACTKKLVSSKYGFN